jgi:hypothetical protein
MEARACDVVMLVYMLMASHVKSLAVGGNGGKDVSISFSSNDDEMKDGI